MSEPVFVGGGPLAGTRKSQWVARVLAGPPSALTVHTAVCRMASKPPSGASRLPETRSPCSFLRNSSTSSVRLMTFLKEKGASLLGQGSFSLGRGGRERERQGSRLHMPALCGKQPPGSVSDQRLASVWGEGRQAHGRDSGPRGHSLLRPHVRLRDADFVHELAKSDSVVAGELAQDLGWVSTGKRGAAESQHLHIDTGARRKRENDPLSTLGTLDMSPRSP